MKNFLLTWLPEIILVVVITVLVSIWFKSGLVLGTGESGLPFYNSSQLASRNRFAWADVIIGSPTNQPGWPFLAFISAGLALHLPPFLIQALFYWLILAIGVLSVAHLSRALSSGRLAAFLAGGFYLLNLFTLVSVINRMLYPFLFLYAWLPLSFVILVSAFKTRRLRLAFWLSLISIPFSLAFASFPFLELWWGIVFVWCVYQSIIDSQNKSFSLKFFLLLLISWILIHLWWLEPLFISTFSTSYAASEVITAFGNIQAFAALSRLVGGMSYVFSLIDRSFFSSTTAAWGKFYLHPIIQLIALIPAIIALSYPIHKKKSSLGWFLFLFFLTTAFFAKGSMPPLGEISTWLVSHFRPLEVFRNAFEKTGFFIILCISLLFGHLLASFSKKIIVTVVFLIFGVLAFPLWTGQVIDGDQVVQPGYYNQANDWFKSQPGQFRIVALPLTGEGATYSWPYRFSGVELSSEQFSLPIISMTTAVPFLDNITRTLESSLANKPFIFPALLTKLNASSLLVRRDLQYQSRQIMDPQTATQKVKSLPNFNQAAVFSNLEIYSLASPSALPWIYVSTDLTYSYPLSSFSDYLFLPNTASTTLLEPSEITTPLKGNILIKPQRDFILPASPSLSKDQAFQMLPVIRYLPSHPFFPLILFKEKLERLTAVQDTESLLRFDLNILGKRLVEISALARQNDPQLLRAILRYKNLLSSLILSQDSSARLKSVSLSTLVNTFSAHETILKDTSSLAPLHEELRQTLARAGLASLYPQVSGPARIIRFDIPREGAYELHIEPEDLSGPFSYQLDGQVSDLSGLAVGEHEIAINLPQVKDLTFLIGEHTFFTPGSQSYPLIPFRPDSRYILEMDYLIRRGNGLEIRFVQDIDYASDSKNRSYQRQRINKDGYNHSWQHFTFEFQTSVGASTGYLEFSVPPYNFCPQSKYPVFDRCLNSQYSQRFNKPGEISITNLHIYRAFTNPVYLYQKSQISPPAPPRVNFAKTNPTQYKVKISSATTPFVLVLSQLKDQGWKISPPFPDLLANGFANAWYIDRKGDFDVTLDYLPQKYLQISRITSLVSAAAISLFLIAFRLHDKKFN